MDTPLVSVCCLVYNHEPFLRECFEGFVMQKTTFPIEVLVHDDASTDHSADIIREYTEKYPDIFKPIYQTENQYSKGVDICGVYQFPRVCGKYIAMCEGDDYWTDPLKLQKQVDFLEENPDFSLCYHDRDVLRNNVLQKESVKPIKDVFEKNEIIDFFIPTQTVVFRNIDEIIPSKCMSLDIVIWMSLSRFGKTRYLDFCGAVYRIHDGGLWSGNSFIENYTRSIVARKACFWHMKGIDRKGLANIIGKWMVWRYEYYAKEKKYANLFWDFCIISFYSLWIGNMDNMRRCKWILKECNLL
ncbi:MAG: glycosyltransferase [Bacteroidales bacterium]|nr:glycosyltransferase [Bacteroidales bacterium]